MLAFFSEGLLAFDASDSALPDASATFFFGIPGPHPAVRPGTLPLNAQWLHGPQRLIVISLRRHQGGVTCSGLSSGALGNGISSVGFA